MPTMNADYAHRRVNPRAKRMIIVNQITPLTVPRFLDKTSWSPAHQPIDERRAISKRKRLSNVVEKICNHSEPDSPQYWKFFKCLLRVGRKILFTCQLSMRYTNRDFFRFSFPFTSEFQKISRYSTFWKIKDDPLAWY
jgi:hypothetical protein